MASPLEMVEASCTGLVRRMVNLPRAISRALDHGLDVMRASGGRRNHHHQFPPPYHVPVQQHHQPPPLDQSFTTNLQPDWSFLAGFEQQFGVVHPFFYACRFVEALKMARDEEKLVFLYLHSPDHPFTPPFCKATLCSEVVVQFLDANFVSWGGGADSGDGLHMATTLRPASFPFCAEQGLVFGNGRAKVEEKRMADLRLRQEGAAYSASLQADQILIRFPNGERKEKTFSCMDKIEAIFAFVDSLGLPGIGRNYRLVSSFPRKAYGVDQMDMTLKDAGIYPLATLFIELV
ncbi:Thioredoxin-like fold [Cynara cardunculus var. scolymus]|uniref:Thioredoxin-like fold n=1 Tax=Cynara cardunculus var. scolymus TaxID=59895 RepID=A0A124SDW1_CYNCS|nr:Thioredoxin-like fold [Cynara cardunculus var. scolymus]